MDFSSKKTLDFLMGKLNYLLSINNIHRSINKRNIEVTEFNISRCIDNGALIITEDNISQYYRFMSDDFLIKNHQVISNHMENRIKDIMMFMPSFCYSSHKKLSGLNCSDINNLRPLPTLDTVFNSILKIEYFGIKDILKPIEIFIEDIKNTDSYKKAERLYLERENNHSRKEDK